MRRGVRTSWPRLAYIAAVTLAILPLAAVKTSALWSSSVSTTVRVTSAEDAPSSLHFRIGKSKATFTGGTGPFPSIAHIDGDRVWLDFGTVTTENSNNSPEVLLLGNRGTVPCTLGVSLSSDIHTLFSVVRLYPDVLMPGEASVLAMKLDTRGVTPGLYEGVLTVSDPHRNLVKRIPLQVRVVASEPKIEPDLSGSVEESGLASTLSTGSEQP